MLNSAISVEQVISTYTTNWGLYIRCDHDIRNTNIKELNNLPNNIIACIFLIIFITSFVTYIFL